MQQRVQHPTDEARLQTAVETLARDAPHLSASSGIWPWQAAIFAAMAGLLAAGLWLAPEVALPTLMALLAIPFFCATALRLAALYGLARPSAEKNRKAPPPLADKDLPTYTVLVPLYREAAVVPGLIAAMAALDYPAEKLEIFLIVETIDDETIAAIEATLLPSQMTMIRVPDGSPRTKPRALNYAMTYATGELVVVYDAEDEPEPDQLRLAATWLSAARSRGVACLQARLNIYNTEDSWLTRQFTIEYSALFDALLPALERLSLPVPLGGTSNHFVRETLVDAGGWDPFNVTEDADLGIRFARLGHKIEILPSTTYEEAPPDFRSWKGQRTRWLKGWTQTFLVHLRQPMRSARDLGPWRLFGLLVLMGGLLLSAFVHPLFYLALAVSALPGAPWIAHDAGATTTTLFYLGIFNLVTGYLAAIALGATAIYRRGLRPLLIHTITMPIYWLLISFAAYRALWDLMRAPFYWEKTTHRGRKAVGGRPGRTSLTEAE